MTYKIQNEAIYKQCEAAGVSPDRARAGVEKHDAGLDDKLAAIETRMKRLYGPAGMNVDPDKHMQQYVRTSARTQSNASRRRSPNGRVRSASIGAAIHFRTWRLGLVAIASGLSTRCS